MIRSKALIPLLAQVNTAGVKFTLLITTDGRMLSHTGGVELYETNRVIASVAAATYTEYVATARAEKPRSLEFLLMDMEGGRLAIAPIHDKYLLVAYAEPTAEVGSIKLKLQAVQRDLAEPLARVGVDDDATVSS